MASRSLSATNSHRLRRGSAKDAAMTKQGLPRPAPSPDRAGSVSKVDPGWRRSFRSCRERHRQGYKTLPRQLAGDGILPIFGHLAGTQHFQRVRFVAPHPGFCGFDNFPPTVRLAMATPCALRTASCNPWLGVLLANTRPGAALSDPSICRALADAMLAHNLSDQLGLRLALLGLQHSAVPPRPSRREIEAGAAAITAGGSRI